MISGVDPFGRTILLSRAVWQTHVLTQRPWMAGNEESLVQAIAAPSWINHDVDYEDRECFYAEHALPAFPHLLIKVVVQFDDDANGTVITVYPLKRQKASEARKWPTP